MRLEVSDTGPGIPRETQTRLFDPYFSTKSASRGIGLSVVDRIVRRIGGEIHLATECDRGTTFQVLLPCAKEPAEAVPGREPATAQVVPPSARITVLLVEDEHLLRQALAKMLHKNDFAVFEAENGSAAIG